MQQTQKMALDINEAAELTGYKKNYLYKMVHEKRIPHFKPGGLKGRLFFKREDLEAFLFRGRQSASYEEDSHA